MRRQLPHISIVSAKNDVKLGISRVQKFLSLKRLQISTDQKYLIKEMGIYQYDPKSIESGKEVPLKVNDHAQDAWRYLVVGMWKQIVYMLPMSERGDED